MAELHRDNAALPLDSVAEVVYKPQKDKGEDAFAYSFENGNIHTQAVFDGCGGAGSWKYQEFKGATGALVAAHTLARAYLNWFHSVPETVLNNPQQAVDSFQIMVQNVLGDLKRKCAPMGVQGSLVKSFPSTVSAAMITPAKDGLTLTAFNDGDSRVYYLTPERGLVQLTADDTQGRPDALRSLYESAPMSDMLNADVPFQVKCRQITLRCPCAVMCATDGVFGYVRSPMDFEYLVLGCIMRSHTFAELESRMQEILSRISGDDSTAIVSFYGFGSYEAVQAGFRSRYEYILPLIRQMDEAEKGSTPERTVEAIWAEYKKQTIFDEMQGK